MPRSHCSSSPTRKLAILHPYQPRLPVKRSHTMVAHLPYGRRMLGIRRYEVRLGTADTTRGTQMYEAENAVQTEAESGNRDAAHPLAETS